MTFFDKLISSLKYYGMVYFIFLIIIIGMGVIYLNKLDFMVSSRDVPMGIKTDTVTAPTDLQYVRGEVMPPVDIMKMGTPTPDLIAKGKTQFTALCSGCHGTEGKGDGPAGAMLNPKPRNFTDLNGWKNGPKFSMMYKTVQEGIQGGAMASFNYLPPIDRISIIEYIRTLNPNYPPVTNEELAEMDKTYSLSKGFKQPNQIPVSAAFDKVLQEYNTLKAKLAGIRIAIDKEARDTGAVIFKRITRDIQKALTVLGTNSLWNENVNEFVKIIESDPVNSGFKTTVYELTPSELNTVYVYLRRMFSS